MALLIVILLISASAAMLYFKGTIFRAFAMLISAILACVTAFAYFEPMANVLISRGTMLAWAHAFAFLLLFIITFAILLTLTFQLTRWPVDFGFIPERIGRVVCGIIAGLILAGSLLAGLSMAPLSNSSPYQRFDSTNPVTDKPRSSLLNTDGLATALFSFTSNGGFRGERSFIAMHPDFLNQAFLNRLIDGVPVATSSDAIEIPGKAAVWPAPLNLKDSSGKPLAAKSGSKTTIVRIGIRQNAANDAGNFTFAQLRLICKDRNQPRNLAAGKTVNIYPVGFLKAEDRVQLKNLTDQMKIEPADFAAQAIYIDFVFDVPENLVPVLAAFKQNCVALLPAPVTADNAPLPSPFIAKSQCATGVAQLQPVESAQVYGIELAENAKLLDGLSLKVKDVAQWKNYQADNSITPAQFDEDKIIHARGELIIVEPNQIQGENAGEKSKAEEAAKPKQQTATRRFRPKYASLAKAEQAESKTANILKPLAGYKLISLKCNNPATGAEIKGEQLPVLVELSGLKHHPVGVIAAGKVGEDTVYEVDYCAMKIEDANAGCLTIGENDAVEKTFPDSVWLTAKAQSISEFYTLYLVKTGGNSIITAVKPADPAPAANFIKYEGFFLK